MLPGVDLHTERRFWRQGAYTWDRFFSPDMCADSALHGKLSWTTRSPRLRSISTKSIAGTLRGPWSHATNGLCMNGYRNESLSLLRLREELSQYELLITFCGSTFDLPMLRAHFSDLTLDQPHIDLCGIGRQLDYHGRLNAIERRMGISRITTLQGFLGEDAVRQ